MRLALDLGCYLATCLCFILANLGAAHFETNVQVTLKIEDQNYNLGVKSASFNGEEIKLDPPDMFKPRKEVQFKLPPGRYSLTWTTQKGGPKWAEEPPKVFEKILVLESGDSVVRVNIKGENVTLY